LRADDEKERIDRGKIKEEGTSLEGVIAGLFPRQRLLDYVENFILFHGEKAKIIGQNHQFIGVNRAYQRFCDRETLAGKLGVFWHTQGSGKSYSMIFYVRKIFRKATGNFTFLVVTDRDDLDGQIYQNFLDTGAVSAADSACPANSAELREFLGQNKRLVFTLIQKFRWEKGGTYPLLSDRSDIVVIVDEAHRTQYKSLAENMRQGLKNANFIAFTGTPLLGRERKTNQWFGDYVSEYNFKQSMDDGATVPLFYRKRVPQVLIQNDDLDDELSEILEDENLDEQQQAKLEDRFSKEIEIIKRDGRLETIARDIVSHLPRRGYLGKAMVVSLDKFTAVRMYDKVKRIWKEEITKLVGQINAAPSSAEKARLKKLRDYMKGVEMAVIVSEEDKEEIKFQTNGLDIKPHRQRMNQIDPEGHDVEHNFKNPSHPLQLVFVCAMWLTGFDAPTVSTLSIDLAPLLVSNDVFKNVAAFKQHADKLLEKDEWRKSFAVYENTISSLYDACKPEIVGKPQARSVALFGYLRDVVDVIIGQADVTKVAARVGELLDQSVVVEAPSGEQAPAADFFIRQSGKTWNLGAMDLDKLREDFKAATYKNIEIADLRAFIAAKLERMLHENATRSGFAQRFQEIIDRYNSGSSTVDNAFEELVQFTRDLIEEAERHAREGLTEEELELFDLLKKPQMTQDETQKVRLAAKSLMHRLKEEPPKVLVQDWFKDGQSKLRVRSAVESVLHEKLPESYGNEIFAEKLNGVFGAILDYATQGLRYTA
jgi:type I site-specific restriction-modification system R (restriction) subunit